MKYFIVCGGTAGHINPGLSIAGELRERDPQCAVLFIGAGRELEKRLIAQAGYPLINIKMSGIRRGIRPQDIMHNIKTVINLTAATGKALALLKEENPAAVIGTGGYICYPVIKAAARLKIPSFIHESNAKPGMTVRKLSAVAGKVMITYPGYERYYRKPERLVVTGTPVRKEFLQNSQACAVPDAKPLVVSFWGSLGAENMNTVMAGFIEKNVKQQRFRHIHAAGNSMENLAGKLTEFDISELKPPYADVREYIDDMPEVMKNADLILCRAGGITLAELAALGKPSILIPSPYVPDNVQRINASGFARKGAAEVIEESQCSAGWLFDTVCGLLDDKDRLADMSRSAASLAAPAAARDIADLVLNMK